MLHVRGLRVIGAVLFAEGSREVRLRKKRESVNNSRTVPCALFIRNVIDDGL